MKYGCISDAGYTVTMASGGAEKECQSIMKIILDIDLNIVLPDEAVITHELTIRTAEDGSFQYLGNKILNEGIEHIPDYQYRILDKIE